MIEIKPLMEKEKQPSRGKIIKRDFKNKPTKYNQKNLELEQKKNFKISNIHKYILKYRNDGIFDLVEYRENIAKKLFGRALENEICWKRTTCEKLAAQGYMTKIDANIFRINQKGIEILEKAKISNKSKPIAKKEFVPGKNHIRFLKMSQNNILDMNAIYSRIKQLPREKQDKERVFKDGMLKNLISNEFLIKIDETIFKLSQKAIDIIKEAPSIQKKDALPVHLEKVKEIKVTKFDIDNILNLSINNRICKSAFISKPNASSIEKRLQTLTMAGLLIKEDDSWILTEKFLDRVKIRNNINLKREVSHSNKLSQDCFTFQQRKTIEDIKDFLNLTGKQILKHIYKENFILYKSEITSLLRKGLLIKDKISDTYILSKEGVKLAAAITGDSKIFGSKINSRREELAHDILVYSAFKDVEEELLSKGKIITSVKTDRVLRSEDMKTNFKMKSEYPDLRIEYLDKVTNERGYLNIEVDLGYSDKVIEQKANKIPNLRWYTNSIKQKEKVLNKARFMDVKIIDDEYWK